MITGDGHVPIKVELPEWVVTEELGSLEAFSVPYLEYGHFLTVVRRAHSHGIFLVLLRLADLLQSCR